MLHGHLDAMVDRSFLINAALKYPLMNIRIPAKLTASTLSKVLPEFQAFPVNEHSNTTSLTSAEYEPGIYPQPNLHALSPRPIQPYRNLGEPADRQR